MTYAADLAGANVGTIIGATSFNATDATAGTDVYKDIIYVNMGSDDGVSNEPTSANTESDGETSINLTLSK